MDDELKVGDLVTVYYKDGEFLGVLTKKKVKIEDWTSGDFVEVFMIESQKTMLFYGFALRRYDG